MNSNGFRPGARCMIIKGEIAGLEVVLGERDEKSTIVTGRVWWFVRTRILHPFTKRRLRGIAQRALMLIDPPPQHDDEEVGELWI